MKKALLVVVLAVFATVSAVFAQEQAKKKADSTVNALGGKTYYVATDGSDSNPGTMSAPFKTIRKGMSCLHSSDTLYIRSGEYNELIDTDMPFDNSTATAWSQAITIAAYNGEQVVIKPTSGNFVFLFASPPYSYIILDGLIIDAANTDIDAVKITYGSDPRQASHHIWIRNSTIRNAASQGILTTGGGVPGAGGYNIFSNLDVYNNGFRATGMTRAHYHGLYISSDNNTIEYSRVHDNSGWGIHIYSEDYPISNNTVRYNLVYNNGKGDNIGHPGIGLYSGPGHQAYGNIVWGNRYGISLNYGAANCVVHDNTIYKNTGAQGDGVPIFDNDGNTTKSNNTLISKDTPDVMPSIPGTGGGNPPQNQAPQVPPSLPAGFNLLFFEPINVPGEICRRLSQKRIVFSNPIRYISI